MLDDDGTFSAPYCFSYSQQKSEVTCTVDSNGDPQPEQAVPGSPSKCQCGQFILGDQICVVSLIEPCPGALFVNVTYVMNLLAMQHSGEWRALVMPHPSARCLLVNLQQAAVQGSPIASTFGANYAQPLKPFSWRIALSQIYTRFAKYFVCDVASGTSNQCMVERWRVAEEG